MAQQRLLTIADQRSVTSRLRWLTLHAPDLARSARAGQYLLVRCGEPGSYDPLLRRPLFIGAAEPALGQIGVLFEPTEPGLAWLARGHTGDKLDVLGPFGQPFELGGRTRSLLLIGAGAGLPALLLLAHAAAARGCAITLLVGADAESLLPPAFLLPSEVEYQTTVGLATDLLVSQSSAAPTSGDKPTSRQGDKEKRSRDVGSLSPSPPISLSPIAWADQICAALPEAELRALAAAIRSTRYRWERGFASALLEGPLVCGVGACGVCAINLRKGPRLLCSAGPVFDMTQI